MVVSTNHFKLNFLQGIWEQPSLEAMRRCAPTNPVIRAVLLHVARMVLEAWGVDLG